MTNVNHFYSEYETPIEYQLNLNLTDIPNKFRTKCPWNGLDIVPGHTNALDIASD